MACSFTGNNVIHFLHAFFTRGFLVITRLHLINFFIISVIVTIVIVTSIVIVVIVITLTVISVIVIVISVINIIII